MKERFVIPAILLCISLLVACAPKQASDTVATPRSIALPASLTFFPVALDKYAGTPYPAALSKGTLALDDGFLKLKGEASSGGGRLIIWPAGFSVREDNGQIQVLYPDGQATINLGDLLELGGGDVPQQIVEKYIGGPLPANALGPYWLTGSVKTNSSLTSSTTPPTMATPANSELIEVVSVRGPLDPINPGGPNVEITLENVSSQPVIALTANLELNRAFNVKFDISAANPLFPGKIASAKQTLIGAGFSDTASYLMVVNGVLQDRQIFSLNKQVRITP